MHYVNLALEVFGLCLFVYVGAAVAASSKLAWYERLFGVIGGIMLGAFYLIHLLFDLGVITK